MDNAKKEKLQKKLQSSKQYFSYMQKSHKHVQDFNPNRAKLLNNLIWQQRLHLKKVGACLYAHLKKTQQTKNLFRRIGTWTHQGWIDKKGDQQEKSTHP